MKIMVTGANGMIGSQLVPTLAECGYEVIGVGRSETELLCKGYQYHQCDLNDSTGLEELVKLTDPDRIIHLAALAHGGKHRWQDYYTANVLCAENVFRAAGDRPVLHISTVDVYGFSDGAVRVETPLNPVSDYGKSKAMAEDACKKICSHYTIFRLSPVYTGEIKRDIQKRYYLRYPTVAYRIGNGSEYEVLSVENAVQSMLDWCGRDSENDIKIIKDQVRMKTEDCIRAEKAEGRAGIVLYFPRWTVICGYAVIKCVTGENQYTYLLNKVVHPLRSEN